MPETTSEKTPLLENRLLHLLIISAIAFCAYSNTFHVPFLFDDEASIQLNSNVHGLGNFFSGDNNVLPNRIVGYFTFALNYQLGGLNVVGYHIVNLLVHIGNSLLVYGLVLITFLTPALKDSFNKRQIGIFAFIVALLFVSHPIQTQAVTYIVQRLTSLATLFYLAAVICYVRWRLTRESSSSLLKGWVSWWYLLSIVTAILAMKTKEIAFTLPLIILLYECSFFGWPGRKLLAQMAPIFLTITIIPFTVFSTINPLLQTVGSLLSDVNTPSFNIVKLTRWEYFYTQINVICTYLRLLVLPVKQNLDYDYPISHHLFETRTSLSLLALLSLFMLALYLYAKSAPVSKISELAPCALQTKVLYRLAAFGLFWFFVTLSVESSIIIIQDVIFEHRLYLPSVGFFLTIVSFAALGLLRIEQHFRHARTAAVPFAAVIILLLAGATYARNTIWGNWISIWSDTAAKSPNKPRAHNILGIGYYYDLKFDEAMGEYREAVRLKPDFIEAYYNMGLIYKERKQYAEAISIYFKILSISAYNADHFADIYNEIGMSYAEIGELDRSVTAFASAVKHNPDNAEFRNNYAFALTANGNMTDALREYRSALSLDPGNRYAIEAIREIEMQKAGGAKHSTIPPRLPGNIQPAN